MESSLGKKDTAAPAVAGSPATIEPATWRDLSALRQLEQVCFPKDAWPLFDLIGVLSFPNTLRLKAMVDGQMVGFVGVDIKRSEDLAWIATIGVLPEYRKRGIASTMLAEVEGRLGVRRIRLSVRASNQTAIRLYTRFGYTHYETWVRYYNDGEDALVLEKALDRARL
jgi:ribosomal-protein-alanine N-acetyltransferase